MCQTDMKDVNGTKTQSILLVKHVIEPKWFNQKLWMEREFSTQLLDACTDAVGKPQMVLLLDS